MLGPRTKLPLLAALMAAVFVSSLAVAETKNEVIAKDTDPAGELAMKTAVANWTRDGWPLLKQYCLDCHNEDLAEGELDLTAYETLDGVDGGASSMQRVLEMVRFGAMPPDDADLPSDDERKSLVASLDATLYSVSCDLRPRPGDVTARRLNRSEYNHAIRDLFGMDLRPADKFPSDEVGAGFDNNGDVLSLSPMLIEKYLTAAEEVAAAVIVDPDTIPRLNKEVPTDQLHWHGDRKIGSFFGMFLNAGSVAWATYDVPYHGVYDLAISGGATEKLPSSDGQDEKAKKQDEGKPVIAAIFDQTGTLIGKSSLTYFGGGGGSDRGRMTVTLAPGKHRFLVQFFDDDKDLEVGKTYREEFDRLPEQWIASAERSMKSPLVPSGKFDGKKYPYLIRRLSLSGPRELPEELFPPSQERIVRRVAGRRGTGWKDVEKSARECLKPLMRSAFRGPVSDDAVGPYANLVVESCDRGESYYDGLRIAVSAVLVSPRFLFRVESPTDQQLAERKETFDPIELTPLQLASRLSFFLWSSLPDESLLSAAEKNRLNQSQVLAEIERMLSDDRSGSLATEFAAQWLGLRNLTTHEADAEMFATFTPELKHAMTRETEALFTHVLRNNLPVAELMTADYTFVNQPLAEHYGIEWPADAKDANAKDPNAKNHADEFRKVSLADHPRRGILGHASVLTLTSNPNRTSPVQRGKWILENVLGTPPPEPPVGVPGLDETKTADAGASLREQLELHRSDPSCASCHKVMDQLGFGLENFDAIGRYRTSEGNQPIDSSGELPGGRSFNGGAELCDVLSKTETESFARTVTARLLTFALGRELSPSDRCTIDAIIKKTAANDYRMVDLIVEVATSAPFRYYEWETPSQTVSTRSDTNVPTDAPEMN